MDMDMDMEDPFLANAAAAYEDIEGNGAPSDPLPFDEARIGLAEHVRARVYNPATNDILEASHVVYELHADGRPPERGYWLRRRLSDCIFGQVRVCEILNFRDLPDAPWELTGHRAAVKIMSWQKIRTLRHVENPLQEVAAMQLVGMHQHVMGALDILQNEEALVLFMPFFPMGTLLESVQRNGRFREPVARRYFIQLLEGLSHLQTMGVCHRDMSPENILLDQDTNSIIIDLGMCLRVPFAADDGDGQVTDVTSGNLRLLINRMTPCGKPCYISPEVWLEGPFDGFAIDLWATGVILFIMLVGLKPWEFAREGDPRFRMISDGGLALRLRELGRPLSVSATDLLQTMLTQNPRHRLSLREVMDHPWVQEEDDAGAVLPLRQPEAWRM